MRREVEQQLKPLGWEVGESPHCHIRFVQQEADRERWTERFKVTSWPTLVLLVDGQEKGRFVGRMAASELSRRMIVLQKETLGKK